MKNLQKLLILSLLSNFIIFLSIAAHAQQPGERDEQFIRITKKLKCLVCNGESVYDSNANFSIAMRDYVQHEINQGKEEEQIIADLVSSYGEEILADPYFSPQTAMLWGLPLLLLFIGFYRLQKRVA